MWENPGWGCSWTPVSLASLGVILNMLPPSRSLIFSPLMWNKQTLGAYPVL